jgi:hypothetical protein
MDAPNEVGSGWDDDDVLVLILVDAELEGVRVQEVVAREIIEIGELVVPIVVLFSFLLVAIFPRLVHRDVVVTGH